VSSYESSVQPIKIGYLVDMTMAEAGHLDHMLAPFRLVFQEGYERGMLDRPVEVVHREVEGLPKGAVKPVIDAFASLVEEGCLAVVGPSISDNAVPTGIAINERFHVPAITMAGAEEWMDDWTFALPAGSMADEPRAWARLIAKGGHRTVGVLVDRSLIGESYIRQFRAACRAEGIRILGEEGVAQTAQDVDGAVRRLYEAGPEALVYSGFGLGVLHVSAALKTLNWDPPRFMGTAWQMVFATKALWQGNVGWVGLDQYDEGNPVGQRFLDRFEQVSGHRRETFIELIHHDFANVLLHALADAQPLSPLGVKEALERVKLLPAACGAPGTMISFGKWMRRGWVGTGYLVAREVLADGKTHRLVDRAIFD
jgi:ABC-type branched-subunit amino acid transport system substrate-binding protein